MPKPELEFFPVDSIPFEPVPGAPPGHYQRILTEDPDKMFVTRMLKVDPGCASTETFVHAVPVPAGVPISSASDSKTTAPSFVSCCPRRCPKQLR